MKLVRFLSQMHGVVHHDVRPVNLRDAGEIERVVTTFAQSPNGGLVVTASALSLVHSALILTLAARHKLPAVYPRRSLQPYLRGDGNPAATAGMCDAFHRVSRNVARAVRVVWTRQSLAKAHLRWCRGLSIAL